MLTDKGKLQLMKGVLPWVYLGGGRDSTWRDEFRKRFSSLADPPTLVEYDPFRMSRQGSIADFTTDDLDGLAQCSLLVARVDFPRFTGIALETGYARARGIPIMLIWKIGGRIDAMMAGCALWVFTEDETAFDYIEERLI